MKREIAETIIAEYRTGVSPMTIVRKHKVSYYSVYSLLTKHKKAKEFRKDYCRSIAEHEKAVGDAIIKEYLDGRPISEIAKLFDCSRWYIQKKIKKNPEAKREQERREAERTNRKTFIIDLILKGIGKNDVAKIAGCSYWLVYHYRDAALRELWLKGYTIEEISERYHVKRYTLKKLIRAIDKDKRDERARKRKLIEEGFSFGATDEQIATGENIPIEEVRIVTAGFNKPRPNPWAIRYPLKPFARHGNGNSQLRQIDDEKNTLELNPPEYSRYLAVRNRRALRESEVVQAKNDTIPAAILNTYSTAITRNGSPIY